MLTLEVLFVDFFLFQKKTTSWGFFTLSYLIFFHFILYNVIRTFIALNRHHLTAFNAKINTRGSR